MDPKLTGVAGDPASEHRAGDGPLVWSAGVGGGQGGGQEEAGRATHGHAGHGAGLRRRGGSWAFAASNSQRFFSVDKNIKS